MLRQGAQRKHRCELERRSQTMPRSGGGPAAPLEEALPKRRLDLLERQHDLRAAVQVPRGLLAVDPVVQPPLHDDLALALHADLLARHVDLDVSRGALLHADLHRHLLDGLVPREAAALLLLPLPGPGVAALQRGRVDAVRELGRG
eukprot:CAMPEP_0179335762 /NCGR_PEP_ID=MMETSP0797-20121207/66669_1 /TAXON_ID=47934 /ORGANISM="Dinophysis acuminata, Strain DAEP01" /LENGTH=145 /DNA_ID=CAMNT_0021049177 /DNA_START=69 /DNA_END=503 /DNA_ORIENTATION=+